MQLRNVLIIGLLGFFIAGCRGLNKSGVYSGDQFLYGVELAIPTGYEVIHSFVKWEHDNRTALTKYPEITKAADVMRSKSKQWFGTAYALHDSYKVNPTDANKTALQAVLDEIRTAMTEATGFMLKASTVK